MTPEPGERMDAVKACSECTWGFIEPGLPAWRDRLEFTLHWLQWLGEFWEMRYDLVWWNTKLHVDVPCVIIRLWPSGECRVLLCGKKDVVTLCSEFGPQTERPAYTLLAMTVTAHGDVILAHMRESCKKPEE